LADIGSENNDTFWPRLKLLQSVSAISATEADVSSRCSSSHRPAAPLPPRRAAPCSALPAAREGVCRSRGNRWHGAPPSPGDPLIPSDCWSPPTFPP